MDVIKKCLGCKVSDIVKMTASQVGSVGQMVVGYLQAHPDVDWVYAPYDPAAAVMVNAIVQAGLQDKVKLVSIVGSAQNIEYTPGQGSSCGRRLRQFLYGLGPGRPGHSRPEQAAPHRAARRRHAFCDHHQGQSTPAGRRVWNQGRLPLEVPKPLEISFLPPLVPPRSERARANSIWLEPRSSLGPPDQVRGQAIHGNEGRSRDSWIAAALRSSQGQFHQYDACSERTEGTRSSRQPSSPGA